MNATQLSDLISQNLAFVSQALGALKTLKDNGDDPMDRHSYFVRKLATLKETAGQGEPAIEGAVVNAPNGQPENRADAPDIQPPTPGEARKAVRTQPDTKQPTVRKSNVLPRRSIKPKAKSATKTRATKPALAKKK